MNQRITAGRRAARYGAVPLALVLALSGCGGGDEPEAGESTPPPKKTATGGGPGPIASMPLYDADGPAHIDLLALTRTAGNTVTARFKIVNDGDETIDLGTSLNEAGPSRDRDLGDALAASGIGLLDARNEKMYFPLHEADGSDCLCTRLHRNSVRPGRFISVYATFPSPPADVQKVTVVVPLSVPFQDVPITGDPVEPLKSQVDPTKVSLKQPRILDVRSLTEGTEQSVDDDPDDRSVRLSADVLFAVDKADLTPRAEQLLKQVAQQIDASKGTKVTVDGHADNTGNDAINQPLSERRAKAVADRLKSLVTRQGVGYESAGHGSKQPVASNDTAEGRRKNRRVTVTFARPPAPAPPPVSGEPYKRNSGAVLGSSTFRSAEAKGLTVEINSLHRDSSGLTVLVWTLRNTGQGDRKLAFEFEKTAAVHGAGPRPIRLNSAGGVMLFDPAAKVRYNPLSVETGPCVCSVVGANEARKVIGPGNAIVYWNAYKPPADAANLELQVPWDRAADAVVKGLTIK
ncbi:OmpA family protein [Actinomadura sp. 7K534]|uniref:OmpA family protein n=1 Tax=Actinomadura sp. 7K534 TaxID=2530366 RepID=UPI001046D88E|nr:OmpA family protein [Actinomadura sp. 7K534]TDB87973.1 OmpA family protein [Actinomadura sp. 7K534]